MNNSELIRTLNKDDLLSIVELIATALNRPGDELNHFYDFANGTFFDLPDEVFDYCYSLTEYERLKLMSLIINTLIHEAEQSTVRHFQTLLPLKSEDFYRP